MVMLKSLECDFCQEILVQYPCPVFYCLDCGRAGCAGCQISNVKMQHPMCAVTNKRCNNVDISNPQQLDEFLVYLHQFAPEDEIKLLNVGKWSPFYCKKCNYPITMRKRPGFIDCDSLYCVGCVPTDRITNVPDNHPIIRIIEELEGFFADVDEKSELRKGMQLNCWKCGDCKRNDMSKQLYFCGEDFLCDDCAFISNIPGCWKLFYSFLQYIPNVGDLHLLTYSKWTPLKCARCSVALSEYSHQFPVTCRKELICQKCSFEHDFDCEMLPAPALVPIIKEFRALFKFHGLDPQDSTVEEDALTFAQFLAVNETVPENEGEENTAQSSENETAPETERRENTAQLSAESCNSSAPSKGMERVIGIQSPTISIRCINCRGPEDISKTLNCHTCEKYGICGFCVTQKHWGHKIENTEREMLGVSFHAKSDETYSTLTRWKEEVDDVQRQGTSAQIKLCESYRQLFTTAVQCGDADLLQSINGEGNANQLHTSVKDYITYGIRVQCYKATSRRARVNK